MLAGSLCWEWWGLRRKVGRTLAALHREARTYVHCTYAEAFAYLVVLLYWLLALRLKNARPRTGRVGKRGPATIHLATRA